MTAYDLITKKMEEEIEKSLDDEISNSLFSNLLNNECKEINLRFDPFFSTLKYQPLKIDETGIIEDINLKKLKKFRESIKNKIKYNNKDVYAIITRHPRQFVRKNDVICYVNSNEDSEVLNKKINRVFIVNKSIKRPKNDLNDFKKLVIISINSEDEDKFLQCLNIYLRGFEHYMDYISKLKIKFPLEKVESPFVRWTFFSIVGNDFNEIAERASKSPNSKFIRWFGFSLREMFEKSVFYTIEYNDNSIFNIVVPMYYSIYDWSFKSGNKVGKDRSISYLKDIILEIINIIEYKDSESYNKGNLKKLLYRTIDVTFTIFKKTIINNDFDIFEMIYNSLSSLKSTMNYIELEEEYSNELLIQWFEASSFIIKKIDLNEFEGEKYLSFLNLLLPEFSNYNKLLKILEMIEKIEYNLEQPRLMDLDILWEEYPTHEAGIIDTMGRILFLFCIRGIQLIKEEEDYSTLNSSITVLRNYNRIEIICNSIKDEKEKWYWLLGFDIIENTNEFLKECEKSKLLFNKEN